MVENDLKREELGDGLIKLTSPHGVKDTRTGRVYSEVICEEKYEKFFVENIV